MRNNLSRFYYLLVLLLIVSCSPRLSPVEHVVYKSDTVRVTVDNILRDTLVRIEPDSSIMRALIECDSTNQAHLTEISQLRSSDRISTSVTLYNNQLLISNKIDSISVYLTLRDRYEKVEHKTDSLDRETITVTENVMYWWQKALMYAGAILLITCIVIIIKKFIK